jgi:hypothetical protein
VIIFERPWNSIVIRIANQKLAPILTIVLGGHVLLAAVEHRKCGKAYIEDESCFGRGDGRESTSHHVAIWPSGDTQPVDDLSRPEPTKRPKPLALLGAADGAFADWRSFHVASQLPHGRRRDESRIRLAEIVVPLLRINSGAAACFCLSPKSDVALTAGRGVCRLWLR